MRRRSARRALAVLAAALATTIIPSSPAAAFYEQTNSGDSGYATFPEMPGVKCSYQDNAGTDNDNLWQVTAMKFWTHGPYSQYTKIAVRFQFQRNTPPVGDNTFVTYSHTSNIVKSANDQYVAYFGPVSYNVPVNGHDRWRVRVLINYYGYGLESNTVVGKIRGLMEVYKHKLPGHRAVRPELRRRRPRACLLQARVLPSPAVTESMPCLARPESWVSSLPWSG